MHPEFFNWGWESLKMLITQNADPTPYFVFYFYIKDFKSHLSMPTNLPMLTTIERQQNTSSPQPAAPQGPWGKEPKAANTASKFPRSQSSTCKSQHSKYPLAMSWYQLPQHTSRGLVTFRPQKQEPLWWQKRNLHNTGHNVLCRNVKADRLFEIQRTTKNAF